jgi:hypothetical protein
MEPEDPQACVLSGLRRDVDQICAFWDITQRRVVRIYQCFGTTCRSHVQRTSWPLKMWQVAPKRRLRITTLHCLISQNSEDLHNRLHNKPWMVPILSQMKWSLSWDRWNGPYPEPDEMVPILSQMKWSLPSARWNGPYPEPDEMVPTLSQMKWSLPSARWNGPYPEPDEMVPILSQMKWSLTSARWNGP